MRFECEDFPGNWIEYADAWTRKEVQQPFVLEGAGLLDFMRTKATAVHLACIGAEAVTEVTAISDDGLANVRWEVFAWLRWTPLAAALELGRLGEASGRRLLRKPEATAVQQTEASPPPVSTPG